MDIRSQFTNRYKKDLSTEYIRTKVARRKSISQKENRHNEFKKSRGLSLADVNISIVKECELPSLEEVAEISVSKGNEKADGCKIKDKMLNERRELLLRFKEEKQLRKLKEQREKASRGIFKCGVYKPDDTLAPVVNSQTTSKAKPKEKPLPPTATRVTRSMAKVEPTVKKTTRPQQTMATVFNSSKNTSERSIPKGRGLSATAKKPDKETKVLTAPLATRAAALTGSKLPSRNTTVSRPQKNIIKEKTNQTINQQAETVEKSIAVSKPILEEDVTPAVLKDDAMRNLEDLKKERKPSFAPQNFTFQPLDGLAPFKFQPSTPPSMPNATPCFTWSPMRSERNAAILNIPESLPHEDCERVLDQMPSVEQSPKPDSSKLQMDTHSSKTEAKECTNEECPVISDSVSPETHESVTETAPNENVPAAPAEEPKHDVPYFRNILKSEIRRLTAMCTQWEEKFEIDIPEEGKI
ncbi:disks large-associated protein 5 [Bombina bombina]|uniref:disks large-associated protein 5 n=1 Tax=Bombina bombina TaxID=8345 RepID=UPI00235A5C09|nr:disks large-associated protein 5 [Bombina bombina]